MRLPPRYLSPILAVLLIPPARALPFDEMWQPKTAPAFVSGPVAPAPSGTTVNVHLLPAAAIRRIPPSLFGNNAAVWDGGRLLQVSTSASLERAGVTVLRFPGGSTSDEYCWDGNYASFKASYPNDASQPWVLNQSWAVNTDEFIGVCRARGAEPMITVNLGLARYGSVAEATSLAARWVKYCNVDHRYNVKYWEVGNENYGDWERGTVFPPGSTNRLSGAQYGSYFNQFVEAMKAVDPSIKVGAVSLGVDSTDPYNGYFGWMRQMLPVVQDTADFLVVHNYFTWVGSTDPPPPATLFGTTIQIGEWKANLDAMLRTYTHRIPGELPYAMTEFNIENPPKHDTVELTNGLFTAIALGEYARTGWRAANLWDVLNGWGATDGGDHAFLAVGQPGVSDGTQRASLYAYALWSRFGDTLVSASSDVPGVKVYGGSYAGSGASALLVNTEALTHSVTVDAGTSSRYPRANLWVLDGDAFTAQQVRFNGVSGPSGGGPNGIENIPPYQVNAGAQGTFAVGLPARSAVLLVLNPAPLYGDVDGNGAVDVSDSLLAARAATGLEGLTPEQLLRTDVNGDERVTPADAALILTRSAGLAVKFPVE